MPRIEQNLASNEQTGPINKEMRNLITSLQVGDCPMAVSFLLHLYLLLTPLPAPPSYSLTFTCISHPAKKDALGRGDGEGREGGRGEGRTGGSSWSRRDGIPPQRGGGRALICREILFTFI